MRLPINRPRAVHSKSNRSRNSAFLPLKSLPHAALFCNPYTFENTDATNHQYFYLTLIPKSYAKDTFVDNAPYL